MLRTLLDTAMRYSPAQPFAVARAAHRLTVLAYHGIDDPERFDDQLAYLRRHCTPIDLGTALTLLRGEAAPPRRPVLVTFDDGRRSLVDEGLPILRAHSIPGVAFVVAQLVDTERPFWWEEVEALLTAGATTERFERVKGAADLVRSLKSVPNQVRLETLDELRAGRAPVRTPQLRTEDLARLVESGIEIGNHSLSHPCLDTCDAAALEAEVSQSQDVIETLTGRRPRAFAYPNGNHNADVRRVAEAAGFDVAFAFDHRLSELPASDMMAVSRVRVASHTSADRFASIVSGLHPAIHHLRGLS